jgi:aerobic-type carbon monoxide dehydrogenase small subunit (CoxS/CutS family)
MADFLFDAADGELISIELMLNGERLQAKVPPLQRLSVTLRDQFGLISVKSGCDAGDCGACTVMMGGQQVCSCMTPTARAHDKGVTTLEGMESHGVWSRIQQALYRHGVAQCGVCMPGMVMAATHVIGHRENPSAEEIRDAMGGVLCRCTGYEKIVAALLDSTRMDDPEPAMTGQAVGAAISHVDSRAKLDGSARYGADSIPGDALWLKIPPCRYQRIFKRR